MGTIIIKAKICFVLLTCCMLFFHNFSSALKKNKEENYVKKQNISLLDAYKKFMVVAPHPDDDVIGCGGVMAKLIEKNSQVFIVYMTSGEAGEPRAWRSNLSNIREQEACDAADVLGVKNRIFLRFPDSKLTVSDHAVQVLKNTIKEVDPDVIFIPHEYDNHPDHKATNQIIVRAVKELYLERILMQLPVILGYEVWTPLQMYSLIEDITPYLGIKMKSLGYHASQLKYQCLFDEAIKGLNRYRGIMSGRGEFCECFVKIMLNF